MPFCGYFFLFSSFIFFHLTHSLLVPIPSTPNTSSTTPFSTFQASTQTQTTPNHDTTQIDEYTQLKHDIFSTESTYIEIKSIHTITTESDNLSTSKHTNNRFIQSMLSHEFLFSALISMAFISCCLVILCVGIFNIKQANRKKKMLHNNISISADQQPQTRINGKDDVDDQDIFLNHIGIVTKNKVKKYDYKQRNINLKISRSPASNNNNKSKSPLSKMLSKSLNISVPTSLNVEPSSSASDANDIVEVTIFNLEEEKQHIVSSIDDIHATKNSKYNEYLTPTEISTKQDKISCELNLILPDDQMSNSIMTGGDGDGGHLTHSRNNLSITKTYNVNNSIHNLSVTRTYNGNNLLNV